MYFLKKTKKNYRQTGQYLFMKVTFKVKVHWKHF